MQCSAFWIVQQEDQFNNVNNKYAGGINKTNNYFRSKITVESCELEWIG
jgi:hypothetical protein